MKVSSTIRLLLALLALSVLVQQTDAYYYDYVYVSTYVSGGYNYYYVCGYYYFYYYLGWGYSECWIERGSKVYVPPPPPSVPPKPPPVDAISAKFGVLKLDQYLSDETDEFSAVQTSYLQNKGAIRWGSARTNLNYLSSGVWLQSWNPSSSGYQAACRPQGVTDHAYLSPNLNSYVAFLAEVKLNTANSVMSSSGTKNTIVACATFKDSSNGQVTLGRTDSANGKQGSCSWNNCDSSYSTDCCRQPNQNWGSCNPSSTGHDCHSSGYWRYDSTTGRRGTDPVSVAMQKCTVGSTDCASGIVTSYAWKYPTSSTVEVCANLRNVKAGATLAIRFDVQMSCGTGTKSGYVEGTLTKVEWRYNGSNSVQAQGSVTGSKISNSAAQVYIDQNVNKRVINSDLNLYSSWGPSATASCWPGVDSLSCRYGASIRQCNILVNLGTVTANGIKGNIKYGIHAANGAGIDDDSFNAISSYSLDWCNHNQFTSRSGACSAISTYAYYDTYYRRCTETDAQSNDNNHNYGVRDSILDNSAYSYYQAPYLCKTRADLGKDLPNYGRVSNMKYEHLIITQNDYICGQGNPMQSGVQVSAYCDNCGSTYDARDFLSLTVTLETKMDVDKWITTDLSSSACSKGRNSNVVRPTYTASCNRATHPSGSRGYCGVNYNNCFCGSTYRYCSPSGYCGTSSYGSDFDYQSSLSHLRENENYQVCWKISNTGDEALEVTSQGESYFASGLNIPSGTSVYSSRILKLGTISNPFLYTYSTLSVSARGLVTSKTVSDSYQQVAIQVMAAKMSATAQLAPSGYCSSQASTNLNWPRGYYGWDVCYKVCNIGNLGASVELRFPPATNSRTYSSTSTINPGSCYSSTQSYVDDYLSTQVSSHTIEVQLLYSDSPLGVVQTISKAAIATVSFKDFSFTLTKTLSSNADCSSDATRVQIAEYSDIYMCWRVTNTGSFNLQKFELYDQNYYPSWRAITGNSGVGSSNQLVASAKFSSVLESFETGIYDAQLKAYPTTGGANSVGYKIASASKPSLDIVPAVCDGSLVGVTSISTSGECGAESAIRPGNRVKFTFSMTIPNGMPVFIKPQQTGHQDPVANFDFKVCTAGGSCLQSEYIWVRSIRGIKNSGASPAISWSKNQVYTMALSSRSKDEMTFEVEVELRSHIPVSYNSLTAQYWVSFESEHDGRTVCQLSARNRPAVKTLAVVRPSLQLITNNHQLKISPTVGSQAVFQRSVSHDSSSTGSAYAVEINERIDSRFTVSAITVLCNNAAGSSVECPFTVQFSQYTSSPSKHRYSYLYIQFLHAQEFAKLNGNGQPSTISWQYTAQVRSYTASSSWSSAFEAYPSVVFGQTSCEVPQSYCPGTRNSRYSTVECASALTDFNQACSDFACDLGYKSRYTSHSCVADSSTAATLGKWSPTPECIEYSGYCRSSGGCQSGNIHNTCSVSCSNGYYMPVQPKCLGYSPTAGTWSSSTSCELKPNYCSEYSHNGQAGMTKGCPGLKMYEYCQPECSYGYSSSSVRCNSYTSSYGRWSSTPTCGLIRYYCPYSNGCSSNSLGSRCSKVSCSYGYSLSSSSAVYCLASTATTGRWGFSGSSAEICSKMANYCSASSTSSSAKCPHGMIDETCTPTCPTGYIPSNTPYCRSSTSTHGTWYPTPSCTLDPNYCTKLDTSAIAGSVGGCTSGTYSYACGHRCLSGYTASTSYCSSGRSWSPAPTCSKTPGWCSRTYTYYLAYGSYACEQSIYAQEVGDTCTISCRTGYAPSANVYTCSSSRSWSPTPACVRIEDWCPTKVGVGSEVGTSGYYGEKTSTSCAYGYTSVTSSSTCLLSRVWSPSSDVCVLRSNYCSAQTYYVYYNCPTGPNTDCSVVTATTYLSSYYRYYEWYYEWYYYRQTYTCQSGRLGDECNHACPTGWERTTNPTCNTRYSSSGVWSTTPYCQRKKIQCSQTSVCPNGVLDQKCQLSSCPAGYRTTVATCQSNNQWSLTPTCEKIPNYCTNSVTCQPATIGESCQRVFPVPAGQSCTTPTCQAGSATQGSWSTEACAVIDEYCPAGALWSAGAIGSTKTISCAFGYKPSVSQITCQADTKWSAYPTCDKIPDYCKKDGLLGPCTANGAIGSACTTNCAVGFEHPGAVCKASTATAGVWDPKASCTPKQDVCASVAAGSNTLNGLPVGDFNQIATFTCALGYSPLPSNGQSKCGSDGAGGFKWSAISCTQTANYCNSVSVLNGSPVTSAKIGEARTVSCSAGFKPETASLTCLADTTVSGKWSAAAKCVKIAGYCDSAECPPTAVYEPCTVQCENGYESSSPAVDCIPGTATSGSFVSYQCVKKASYCPATSAPAHGTGCTANVLGAECVFSCNEGYQKANQPTCTATSQTSGSWSTQPLCEPVAGLCPATTPANAVTGCVAGAIKDQCSTLACADGFRRDSLAVCTSTGAWSPAPSCSQTPGFCSASAVGGAPSAVRGATHKVVCPAGYQASADATCTGAGNNPGDGSWQPTPACTLIANYCQHAQCAAAAIGGSCSPTCSSGYESAGDVTCISGGVFSPAPACNKIVGYCAADTSAEQPPHTNAGCSAGILGASCGLACGKGYTANNPVCVVASALAGAWSPAPSCIAKAAYCSATTGTAYVATELSSAKILETRTLSCANGYQPERASYKCIAKDEQNGMWDYLPKCVPIPNLCPAPAAGANVASVCQDGQAGEVCSFSCALGYTPSNTPQCTPTGAASGAYSPAPACRQIEDYCPAIAIANSADGCANANIDEQCAFNCKSGYKPNSYDVTCDESTAGSGLFTTNGAGTVGVAPRCDFVACPSRSTFNAASGTCECPMGFNNKIYWNDADDVWYGGCERVQDYCNAQTITGSSDGCAKAPMEGTCDLNCDIGWSQTSTDPICGAGSDNNAGSGVWDVQGTCAKVASYCSASSGTANVATEAQAAKIGESAAGFACAQGYDANTPVCYAGADGNAGSGVWSPAPQCTPSKDNCVASTPADATSGCAVADTEGACVGLVCKNGFKITSGESVCVGSGVFEPQPACGLIDRYCVSSVVANGGNCAAAQLGDSCSPTCDGGYKAVAGSCAAADATAGAWSPTPACQLIVDYCPLVTGDNFESSCPNERSVGETCTPVCETGYKLTTSTTCQADGTWDATPACELIPDFCAAQTSKAFATSSCAATHFGATCQITCQAGYESVTTASCGTAGWNVEPQCTPIADHCDALVAVSPMSQGCAAGDMAEDCTTLKCQLGYKLNTATTTCSADKTYQPAPTCSKIESFCPELAIQNGQSFPASVVDTTLNPVCNAGYEAPTGAFGKCTAATSETTGIWNPQPACTLIVNYCPLVTGLHFASGCPDDRSLDETCTPVCETGFYLTTSATCQADGTWDATPTCEAYTDFCVATSGTAFATSECANAMIDGTCSKTCQTGYEPSAASSSCIAADGSARHGVFSPAITCEPIADWCASETATAGASCEATDMAGSCTPSKCQPGYANVNGFSHTCQADKSYSPPIECLLLPAYCAENNYDDGASCASTTLGGSCGITCDTGYAANAASTQCTATTSYTVGGGAWQPAPACEIILDFCKAQTGEHVSTGCQDSVYQTVCDVECATGYYPETDNVVCGADGQWSSAVKCIAFADYCDKDEVGTKAVSACSAGRIGDTCDVACADGYENLQGTATCQGTDNYAGAGEYLPAAQCTPKPDLCASVTPAHATAGCATLDMDEVCASITCEFGYTATDKNFKCGADGSLSPTPACTKVAAYCDATVTAYTVSTCGTGIIGEACTAVCSAGYSLTSGSAACVAGDSVSGLWQPAPVCEKTPGFCAEMTAVNGATACAASKLGDACTFTCATGYTPKLVGGTAQPTCTVGSTGSGAWSFQAECILIADYCQATTNGVDMATQAPDGILGAEFTVTCKPGHEPEAVSGRVTCVTSDTDNESGSGSWVDEQGQAPGCKAKSNYCSVFSPANSVSGCGAANITQPCVGLQCTAGYQATTMSSYAKCYPDMSVGGADGIFTPAPGCELIPNFCAQISTVENSKLGCAGKKLGEACGLVCEEGYEASAGEPICTSQDGNGVFSPAPACTPIKNYCPATTTLGANMVTGCPAGDMEAECVSITCDDFYNNNWPVCVSINGQGVWQTANGEGPSCDPIPGAPASGSDLIQNVDAPASVGPQLTLLSKPSVVTGTNALYTIGEVFTVQVCINAPNLVGDKVRLVVQAPPGFDLSQDSATMTSNSGLDFSLTTGTLKAIVDQEGNSVEQLELQLGTVTPDSDQATDFLDVCFDVSSVATINVPVNSVKETGDLEFLARVFYESDGNLHYETSSTPVTAAFPRLQTAIAIKDENDTLTSKVSPGDNINVELSVSNANSMPVYGGKLTFRFPHALGALPSTVITSDRLGRRRVAQVESVAVDNDPDCAAAAATSSTCYNTMVIKLSGEDTAVDMPLLVQFDMTVDDEASFNTAYTPTAEATGTTTDGAVVNSQLDTSGADVVAYASYSLGTNGPTIWDLLGESSLAPTYKNVEVGQVVDVELPLYMSSGLTHISSALKYTNAYPGNMKVVGASVKSISSNLILYDNHVDQNIRTTIPVTQDANTATFAIGAAKFTSSGTEVAVVCIVQVLITDAATNIDGNALTGTASFDYSEQTAAVTGAVSFFISEPKIDGLLNTDMNMKGVISGSKITYTVTLINRGSSELYNTEFTFANTVQGQGLTQTATPNEMWSWTSVTSSFPVVGKQNMHPSNTAITFDITTLLGDDTVAVAGQLIPITMTWTGYSTPACAGCTPRQYTKTMTTNLFFSLPEHKFAITETCQDSDADPLAVGDTFTITGKVAIPVGTTKPINLTYFGVAADKDFLTVTGGAITAATNGAQVVANNNGVFDLSGQIWTRSSTALEDHTLTYTVTGQYKNLLKRISSNVLTVVGTFCFGEDATMIICRDQPVSITVGVPDLWVNLTTTSSDTAIAAGTDVSFTAIIQHEGTTIATEAYPTVDITYSSNFNNLRITSMTQGGVAVSGFSGTGKLATLKAGEQIVIEYTLTATSDSRTAPLTSRVTVSTPTSQCPSANGLTATQSDDVLLGDEGQYTITYFGEDDYFNVGNCTFQVTYDVTPPVVDCATDKQECTRLGYDYAVLYYTLPAVTDNLAGYDINTMTMTPSLLNGTHQYKAGFSGDIATFCIDDLAGNTGCCTMKMTVNDCEDPQVECKDVTLYTAPGSSMSAPYDPNVLTASWDNVGVVSSTEFDTDDTFQIGATQLLYSACDQAGNCKGCIATVTVEDKEAPVLTCPADMDKCTNNGVAYWQSVYGFIPSVTDNDMIVPPVQWNKPEGTKLPLGVHTITLTIEDRAGNEGNCSFEVSVTDCQAPVPIDCPADPFTRATHPGQNYWTAIWNTPAFTDNYLVASVTEFSGLAGTNLVAGQTYTIQYKALDFAQNYAWCNFTINIVDQEPPKVLCQNRTVYNAVNRNGTVVTLSNSATDNVGVAGTSYSNVPAGDWYTMGTHTVTFTAVDTSSLSASCTSYIFVLPICGDVFLTSPEECDGGAACSADCTCPEGYEPNDVKGCKVVCPVDSTDPECGYNGTCEVTIISTPAPVLSGEDLEIELIEIINSLTDGQAEVDRVANLLDDEFSWSVVDSATYSNGDFEATNEHVDVEACCPYNYQPTMWIEVDGVLVNSVDHCNSVHAAAVAAGTATYTRSYNHSTGCWMFPACATGNFAIGQAKNETGNMVECVALDFTEPLAVDSQYVAVAWLDADIFNILPPFTIGSPVPNVSFSVTTSHPSGTGFPLGTTTVTYTFDQGDGFPQSCRFTVEVTDPIPPRMECPFDDNTPTAYRTDIGYGYATVLFDPTTYSSPLTGQTENGAFDWGDYAVVAVSTTGFNSNNRYTPGSYTLTWSSSDSSANPAACTFSFTVRDEQPPIATCTNYTFATNPGSTEGTISGISVTAHDYIDGTLAASRNCCRICSTGQACGGSCISATLTCHQPVGCACNADDTLDGTSSAMPTTQDLSDGQVGYQFCATDSTGNQGCCVVWVEVYDAEPPTITCPADVRIPLNTAPPHAISGVFATAHDAQGPTTISCTSNATLTTGTVAYDQTTGLASTLNMFEQDILVTCTTTDSSALKLKDTCSFSIDLIDVAPPVVTCPDDILVVNNYSSSTNINLPLISQFVVTDNDIPSDEASITAQYFGAVPTNPFSNPFPTTTYTAEAFDLAGNRGTCTFTITVQDESPPCKTCPSDITLYTSTHGTAAAGGWTVPTMYDCETQQSYDVSAYGDAALLGPTSALTPETVYKMAYYGADASGNGVWCNFTVTYEDDVEPSVDGCVENPGWEVLSANEFGLYTYSWSLTASDDVTAAGAIVWLANSPNGNTGTAQDGSILLSVGQYTFNFYVRDLAGNWNSVNKCAKKVWVVDTTAPKVTCRATDIEKRSQTGNPVEVCFPGGYATATDARTPLAYTASPASCSLFSVGTTTVTVTVTDPDCTDGLYPSVACGMNAATCTFDVVVTSPYPQPNFGAVLLKSVITPIDGATGADGNQKFGASIDFMTAVRNPHQVNTNPNAYSLTLSNPQEAEAGAIAFVAGEGSVNYDDGQNYFQTWSLGVEFKRCDVADQTFTIDFSTLCVGSTADPCLLGSLAQQVVITFRAEDFCQNKLADVLVSATLKTYTSAELNAFKTGTALPATQTVDFALGDIVGAVVEATSGQVLFKRIDMVRARRDYYYSEAARTAGNPTDVFYTHAPVFADPITGNPTSGSGSAYGSGADFASPVTGAAWFSFTEDVDPVQVFNNNNEAFVEISATVAVKYTLDAQGSASGRRRVLKLLTQDVPKTADAFGLNAMRRRMTQDEALSETTAEASSAVSLSTKTVRGPDGKKTSSSESTESGPPRVVYYALAVVIAMFFFCCICVGGCFYVSKAKLLPVDNTLEEDDLAKPTSNSATLHLSPRQDSDALRVHASPRV